MDLVVDTNSLPDIFRKIDKVNEKYDRIYLPRCVAIKEAPSVFRGLINIEYKLRELESSRVLYIKNPKKRLPERLKKALIDARADRCDRDVVKLALERKERSGSAIIITKDEPHFHNVVEISNHLGHGNIIFPEDYN